MGLREDYNEIKERIDWINNKLWRHDLAFVGCKSYTEGFMGGLDARLDHLLRDCDWYEVWFMESSLVKDMTTRPEKMRSDRTMVPRLAGAYGHHVSGAPTRNDGAYGWTDEGVFAATGHNELYWRAAGSDEWVVDAVPEKFIITDVEDESLERGVYAVKVSDLHTALPFTQNFPGHSPADTYAVLEIDMWGRKLFHAYYGQRHIEHSTDGRD